jgi:uncharacterized protein DUF5336
MAESDIKNLPRNDQIILGAGVLAFIASFLPYYGASGSFFGHHASTSTTAWHSWNVLAMLLILAATAIAAVIVFAASSMPSMPVSPNFAVAGLAAVGTLILIIRSFTLDHGKIAGFSYGLRWGAYVLMILCVVQTVFAVTKLRESGEAMPWESSGSAAPPSA